MIAAVPTNIITGFLGVGKTSTILDLLAQKPKHERWAILINEFGEVGIDGKEIPEQWALEIDPEAPLIRVRDHEIELPEPTNVNQGEKSRRQHGEDRHRFGTAVDDVAPFRAEEKEDRRDQRTRMADADPKNKIGDVEAPEIGATQPRDADVITNLIAPTIKEQRDEAPRNKAPKDKSWSWSSERMQQAML